MELASSTAAASWIERSLWPWERPWLRAGSVIPEGFTAYARIVHPSERESEPFTGSLPRPAAERLVDVLRGFTFAADRCWFGIWDGFGFLDQDRYEPVPKVRVPNRAYLLFQGPIDVIKSMEWNLSWQTPNLWWPEDRSWCVATEIDLAETYVGGSDACIARILEDRGLDAFPMRLDARIIDGHAVDPEESPMS